MTAAAPAAPAWKRRILTCAVAAAVLSGADVRVSAAAPPPPAPSPATSPVSPVKALLADETGALERDLAARMMRRSGDLAPDRRARLELEIDLRIVERTAMAVAADAKFESTEQAVAWIRAKQ